MKYSVTLKWENMAGYLSMGFVCILSMLSLSKYRSRKIGSSILLLLCFMALGCKRSDLEFDSNKKAFLRIAQVDKDGAISYSKVVSVVKR